MTEIKQKGKQGFASMDPIRRREICSKGGKSAHEKGTAHQWTSEEARAVGRLGGKRAAEAKKQRKAEDEMQEAQNG